jgi:hypothetical protein
MLYRRVDIEDVVSAHLLALEKAKDIGFGRYIVSATTPFSRDDLALIRGDAPEAVRRLFPDQPALYAARKWTMFPGIDRVLSTNRRAGLGWRKIRFRACAQIASRGTISAARSHGPSASRAIMPPCSRTGLIPWREARLPFAARPGYSPAASPTDGRSSWPSSISFRTSTRRLRPDRDQCANSPRRQTAFTIRMSSSTGRRRRRSLSLPRHHFSAYGAVETNPRAMSTEQI